MEIRDPKSIKKIKEARDLIADFQRRLFRCEETLDDLARAVEIATISNQFQLLTSFVQEAQVCLEDRLTIPEISAEELNRPVVIIEDDSKNATSKSA